MTKKQIKYSRRKVQAYLRKTQLRFFLSIAMIFAISATISALTAPEHAGEAVTTVTTAALLSMAAVGNIEDVMDKDVAGEALDYKVWLIHTSQIDPDAPFPKPDATRQVADIPLRPGERPHYFEAHDIPEYESSGERGDLTTTGTNTLTIIMGGVRDQLLNFIENFAGGKFIVIFQECETNEKYIIGTPCRPMILQTYNVSNNKESRSVTFTFQNRSIRQYYKYAGALTASAAEIHPAGTAKLTIKPGASSYRIPNGSSEAYAITSFAGVAPADIGRQITLIGEGTDKPCTISEASGIVLKDGATWTARAGSRLTLQIFDETTLVEVARTQA